MTEHPDSRKILIVDDNPDIHRDFANILEPPEETDALNQLEEDVLGIPTEDHSYQRNHFQLFYATQGEQALAMVEEAAACADPFRLAFVDMRMPPGWDGLETIERLWQVDPKLQVVLCTAYSDHSGPMIQQHLGPTENLLIQPIVRSAGLFGLAGGPSGSYNKGIIRGNTRCVLRIMFGLGQAG